MALSESSTIDSINVTENGSIEVRRADRVFRDDVEIAKTYHRHVLHPGDSLEDQDPKVVSVAEAVWTPEVLAAYEASIATAVV